MRWYVYVYYDEDHQPYYCGKGLLIAFHRAHEVPSHHGSASFSSISMMSSFS